jgi:hypothetical protein
MQGRGQGAIFKGLFGNELERPPVEIRTGGSRCTKWPPGLVMRKAAPIVA